MQIFKFEILRLEKISISRLLHSQSRRQWQSLMNSLSGCCTTIRFLWWCAFYISFETSFHFQQSVCSIFFCYLTRAAAVEKFRTDVHSQIIILMTNLSPFLSMCVCVYAKKIIQIYYFNLECKDYKWQLIFHDHIACWRCMCEQRSMRKIFHCLTTGECQQ